MGRPSTPVLPVRQPPTLQRTIPKSQNKYYQKRNRAVSIPISTLMCLWAFYIFPVSVYLFSCRKICGPILAILQTRECGNWDWGRAISFLGIHKWNFRSSVWPNSRRFHCRCADSPTASVVDVACLPASFLEVALSPTILQRMLVRNRHSSVSVSSGHR